MARFDVLSLSDGALVLDCQPDLLSGLRTRFVVPLTPLAEASVAAGRLNPLLDLPTGGFVMVTQAAATIDLREIRKVGDLPRPGRVENHERARHAAHRLLSLPRLPGPESSPCSARPAARPWRAQTSGCSDRYVPCSTQARLRSGRLLPLRRRHPARQVAERSAGRRSRAKGAVAASSAEFFMTVAGQPNKVFNPNQAPGIVTTQGAVEQWVVQNRTGENHEFHIHQIHFLVQSQNFSPQAPGVNGQFLDMIDVPAWSGTGPYPSVTLLMDFRGAVVGDFVFHCHILQHEDAGMMNIVRVNPAPVRDRGKRRAAPG